MISIIIPVVSTPIVLPEQPFHSLSIMPQTFENTTLRAMSMQNENVMSTGLSAKKPFPRLRPKNWLYQRAPASKQNSALLPQTELLA